MLLYVDSNPEEDADEVRLRENLTKSELAGLLTDEWIGDIFKQAEEIHMVSAAAF